MNNAASADWLNLLMLFPALGIAAASFGWLLLQMVLPRRASWISAVAVPLTLAGAAAVIAPPLLAGFAPRPVGLLLLGLAAAAGAGFFFDQGSALLPSESGRQCRRSTGPLLLWGTGAFMYIAGPWLDRWSAAVVLTGGAALLGQTCGWIWRLCRVPSREPALWRRLVGLAGGITAAAVGFWLLLPDLPPPSSDSVAVVPKEFHVAPFAKAAAAE